jgi:hypothetical protein
MNNDFSKLTAEQARKTSLVVAGVLLLISVWGLYRERFVLTSILGGIAVCLIVIGFYVPSLSKRFHVVWMTIAFALGWVNSRILLTILFFTIFVPYGLLSRLFRRDPLDRRGAARESYWVTRKNFRQEKEGFERLF